MARPKTFDTDQVLEQATSLFWAKGYKATTVRDLETHLGLRRQSLYNEFGDKHALFLKTLERYSADARKSEAWRDLGVSGAGLAEIEAFFDGFVCFATPEGVRPGCFIVNTVAELAVEDDAASEICRENRRGLAELFSRALQGAVERDEIPAPADLPAAADFLVSQAYGILLLAKNGEAPARLRAIATQALRAIV